MQQLRREHLAVQSLVDIFLLSVERGVGGPREDGEEQAHAGQEVLDELRLIPRDESDGAILEGGADEERQIVEVHVGQQGGEERRQSHPRERRLGHFCARLDDSAELPLGGVCPA